MADFITPTTEMPTFLMFPRFLLDVEISETSKLAYLVLLNRARLSQKNEGWTDKSGHVFIIFPIEDLAAVLHKGETTIKTSLAALVKAGLIQRDHQGVGKADHIFVKLPAGNGNPLPPEAENRLPDGQKTVSTTGEKPSGSNNNQTKITESKEESKSDRTAYGAYGNVFLTKEEYADLRYSVSGCDGYIEKLSGYIASTGRRYQSHHTTIRSWASRDNKLSIRPRYECKEDESL